MGRRAHSGIVPQIPTRSVPSSGYGNSLGFRKPEDIVEAPAPAPERPASPPKRRRQLTLRINADTFEQFAADEKAVGDARKWLTEQDVCQVTLWNNAPLLVTAPNFVELEERK